MTGLQPCTQENADEQCEREYNARQNAGFQIAAADAGGHADQCRTDRASDIAAQSQKCEHRGAAAGNGCGSLAECSRPKDAD